MTEIHEKNDPVEATHAEQTDTKWLSTADAQRASEAEHNTTLWEAIRTNKKAVFWSMVLSLSIIMEGYDTSLLPSFYGYPSFQKKYGNYYPKIGGYQLSGAWQAGLSNAATCGVVFGGFINGWASNRFGYKRVMLVSLFAENAFIFITFFAPSAPVLVVGELLCGIPWGVFATTGPAYASEVCPLALRGYLTVYINLCWATGQLLAGGIIKALVTNSSEWSYRIPFAIQWAWPLPLFVTVLFAPESPWWLVKADRLTEAKETIRHLTNQTADEIKDRVAQMYHTIRLEEELDQGSSYRDCFRRVNLRRTEICCVAFAGQMLSGAQFAYGPAYFFEQAGMSPDKAYGVGLGGSGLLFVGTVSSWLLLTYFGRRTIYLAGISILTATLLLIGIVSATTHGSTPGMWAQASLCLVWQLVYALTLGPITYAIISETSAIQVRAKTVVLSRNVYNVVSIVSLVLEPYMMNPTSWNWQGRTAFFWSGSAFATVVWAYFRLPECKVSLSVHREESSWILSFIYSHLTVRELLLMSPFLSRAEHTRNLICSLREVSRPGNSRHRR